MENKITNSIWLGVAVRDTADDASANDNPFVFTDGTLVDDDKMILKFLDAYPKYALTEKKCAYLSEQSIGTQECEVDKLKVLCRTPYEDCNKCSKSDRFRVNLPGHVLRARWACGVSL